jgi:hypothetical protein
MVPGWIFAISFGITMLSCAATVSVVRNVRTMKRIMDAQHCALVEAMNVVDCLSQRGAIRCDICGDPIAPRTATDMDYINGVWSIAHAWHAELPADDS